MECGMWNVECGMWNVDTALLFGQNVPKTHVFPGCDYFKFLKLSYISEVRLFQE